MAVEMLPAGGCHSWLSADWLGNDSPLRVCLPSPIHPSTFQASLAAGIVDAVLIPEVQFSLEGEKGLLAFLDKRMRDKGHCVVVVAEGAGQVRGHEQEMRAQPGVSHSCCICITLLLLPQLLPLPRMLSTCYQHLVLLQELVDSHGEQAMDITGRPLLKDVGSWLKREQTSCGLPAVAHRAAVHVFCLPTCLNLPLPARCPC
jgi:hypothetical protein